MLGSTLLAFLEVKKAACWWKAWTCVHFSRLHPLLAVTSLRLRHFTCETTFIIGFRWRVLSSCCQVFQQCWALSKGSRKNIGHYCQGHVGFLLVGPDEPRSILYLPTPPALSKNGQPDKTLIVLCATDSLQIHRHAQTERNGMEKGSSWRWKRNKKSWSSNIYSKQHRL